MAENDAKHFSAEILDVDEAEYSDVGSSIDSDFTSLASSIQEHVYENGRRYHSLNAGKYHIPNDEAEQARLDMVHHAISIMLKGELQMVKLPEKLDRVLDVGTGTGIWAIDFADSHPETKVIGVDLSPIQPSWVPPNCTFEVDDVEKPWLWKEPFDYIHSAYLAQGIRDWTTYTKQIYDGLRPGGVVQLLELNVEFTTDDDSVPKGGYIERYQEAYNEAAKKAGLKNPVAELGDYLRGAGFVDVAVVVRKLPVGPWAKDPQKKILGRWGFAIVEQGVTSYGLALFTRHLEMSSEEANELCQKAFAEMRRRDVHISYEQWFVEGRKPDK